MVMNFINYLNHSLYSPNTYFRRFDFDLVFCPEKVQRIALAALPFIAMYGPAGKALSLASNSLRIVSHIDQAFTAETEGKWHQTAFAVGKVFFGVFALGVSLFHCTAGLAIMTGCDLLQGIDAALEAYRKNDGDKFKELSLQTVLSFVYLSFMITGSLEIMVLFATLRLVSGLYEAKHEVVKGHYIEAFSKILLSGFHLNSVRTNVEAVIRRNAFLKRERTASLFAKVLQGRSASHLLKSPLSSLKERVEANDLVLVDHKGKELHLGSHFHGHGRSLVKGENLAFYTEIQEKKEEAVLEFKVNHAFRNQVQQSIEELEGVSRKEMKEILVLSGSHAQSVSVSSGGYYPEIPEGRAYKITAEGLGTIFVGADKEVIGLYNKVIVRMDMKTHIYALHELLSLVNLSDALSLSTKEDLERLKMGHLFRTFFPKEALSLERSLDFFTLSLEDLRRTMIQKAPGMEEIFLKYYGKMEAQSLIGGRIRYRIPGLSEAAYQEGARALITAITGAYESDDELFERVALILKVGLLSMETRHSSHLNKEGLGYFADYYTGGSDSVYTQLITQSACQRKVPLSLLYYSKVRFLVSLDALELGSYQYHGDSFGNRLCEKGMFEWLPEFYSQRDNILDFIRKEQLSFHIENEVMLKERVSNAFFKGLVVSDEKTKSALIAYLRKCQLIENDKILGKSINQFIRVGSYLTEDLLPFN